MSKFFLCAVLGLATMPAFAQPVAASPPLAVAASSPTKNVASAATAMQGKAAALAAQLDGLLAPSRSPRDQALRWDLGRWPLGAGESTPTPRASLRDAAMAAKSDRLVQWLWARATPAESGCGGARACPARAQALAKLEPGNGAAWLPVLEQAWDDEDEAAMDRALSRMAKAQAFDDLFSEFAGAWEEVENRFPAYVAARSAALSGSVWADSSDVASMVAAMAHSTVSAIPSMATLVNVCDRGKHPEAPAARLAQCGAIGRLMLDKGTTVLSRSIGFAVLRHSGEQTGQDRLANRRLRWSMQQSADLHLDTKDRVEFRRYFADLLQTGDELAAMERQVARAGKAAPPPAGWKAPGED